MKSNERRIIKFRAWDSRYDGYMRGWQEIKENNNCSLFDQELNESIFLMQYTGLKDKNGKECYWDDWVTDGINPKFLVTPDYHLLARLSEIEFEIVGNKYENPELLDK